MRNKITGEHSMLERQAIGVQFCNRVGKMDRERTTGAKKTVRASFHISYMVVRS
jgi:hypothetical protein